MKIDEFVEILNKAGCENKIVILKLSATWCNPCKKINPTWKVIVDKYDLNNRCKVIELDIDESPELYTKLKRSRMVNGIPAFLMWNPSVSRDNWVVHDNGICSSDPNILMLWVNNLLKGSY